jgi:hypothetical protein
MTLCGVSTFEWRFFDPSQKNTDWGLRKTISDSRKKGRGYTPPG